MNKLHIFAKSQRALRKLTGIFLALFAVLGTSLLIAPASYAASTISIDGAVFENSTVEDGDRVSMKVSWSIPDTATNPISIKVPFDEGLVGIADRFAMVGPGGVTAGECTVTEAQITCTVDEAFVNSNPKNVKGEFWFDVRVDMNNDETLDHTFDFGGNKIPVTIERDSSRCDTTCEFPGYKLKKFGSYNSADDTITWTVRVPAPESGIPAGHNITIADDLDTDIFEMVKEYDGETYPQLWEAQCLYVNSSNEYAPRWHDASSKTGYAWNVDETEVGFTSRVGDMASSTRCAKETEGSFYQAVWVVKVKDLGAAGTYENKGSYTIDGSEPESTTGSVSKRTGGGNVDGDNEGNFSIVKNVEGDGADLVAADTEFTVNYTYPAAEGYEAGEGTLTVKADGTAVTSNPLPTGAVISLTEATPATVEGAIWGEATFSPETLTIGDGTTAEVTLTNTITKIPTVDPTDPTDPTVDPTDPTVDPTDPTVDPTDNSSSTPPDTDASAKPKDELADTGVSTGILIAVPAALFLIVAGAIAFASSRKRHS